jgi:hypothetical protein
MPGNPNNLAVGDIVMSFLRYEEFRETHGDTGEPPSWVPLNGHTRVLETPVHELIKRGREGSELNVLPDFSGRYPRGVGDVPGDPGSGKSGDTTSDMFASHTHTVTQDIEGFDHGDGEHGPVWNPRPTTHSWTTSAAGGAETRPKSVCVYFYLRVR